MIYLEPARAGSFYLYMILCFATNNQHKLAEIQALLGHRFTLKTLEEIGCTEDIPETQATIAGNSQQKSAYVTEHFQTDNFADDTGLEVSALNGEPGVHSARYAGPQRNSDDNIDLILKKLKGVENRSARFLTVITLSLNNQYYQFEGSVEGKIIDERRGTNGFGYDPVFIPDGFTKTFAEMTMEEKGKVSHRGRAFEKLVRYLSEQS